MGWGHSYLSCGGSCSFPFGNANETIDVIVLLIKSSSIPNDGHYHKSMSDGMRWPMCVYATCAGLFKINWNEIVTALNLALDRPMAIEPANWWVFFIRIFPPFHIQPVFGRPGSGLALRDHHSVSSLKCITWSVIWSNGWSHRSEIPGHSSRGVSSNSSRNQLSSHQKWCQKLCIELMENHRKNAV